MTEDERDEFRGKFDNEDDFKTWLDHVQEDVEIEEDEDPFEGKELSDFTWRDYIKLDQIDAAAFREKFFGDDDAAFEEWANRYIEDPDLDDDDMFSGKVLDDFTFDDYFEMDSVDQAAFCEKFFGGDDEALFEWLDSQIEEPDLSE